MICRRRSFSESWHRGLSGCGRAQLRSKIFVFLTQFQPTKTPAAFSELDAGDYRDAIKPSGQHVEAAMIGRLRTERSGSSPTHY